ncbi:hypothetical protein M9Y10_020397 [Tritrichomonas musculus]|uniref:Intimal thickness related receptor IRP domain-containing protein n=1 Tax=Tritrichomonas musculus TaxID=1915356 RepID=A0ABR2HG09_9EUKA
MSFILSLIIAGRFSFHIGPNKRQFSIPFLFGFQTDAKYSIDIKNNEDDKFIFLIATEEDMEKYMSEQNLYLPCNVTIPIDYYHITQLNKTSNTINGTIKKGGKYNTTVLSCEYFHSEFSFELIYKNPNSCLSSNVQNTLIINPIITLISMILFIAWLINWVKNFTMKNIIHTIFSFSFFFFVLQKFFFLLETIEKNKSDNPSHYEPYRELFQLLSLTYILTSFLTIENQFFMNTFERTKFVILFFNVIFSYNLAKCLMETDYFDETWDFDFDDFDFKTIAIISFWEIDLFLSTILTYGFNSETLNCCFTVEIFVMSIMYVLFYTFYSIENTFLYDYYIVLIIDVINIAFLAFFGYKFRLNPNTLNNYLCLQIEEEL